MAQGNRTTASKRVSKGKVDFIVIDLVKKCFAVKNYKIAGGLL
jgi:hypothetical protein